MDTQLTKEDLDEILAALAIIRDAAEHIAEILSKSIEKYS